MNFTELNSTATEQTIFTDSTEKYCDENLKWNEWKSLGYFKDNFRYLNINEHWLKFSPPEKESHYILVVLYIIITIIGCLGNALVIYLLVRCISLRTSANILVMNLALSDFLMFIKTPIFIYNSLHFGPALGYAGCQIYGFIGGLTGVASIMSLAAIAFDRYRVIVYPLRNSSSKNGSIITAICIWCYSATFSLAPVIGLARPYVPEGYLTTCSFDYLNADVSNLIFIGIFMFAGYVFPLSIILLCYCGILKAVRKTGPSRTGQEREKRRTEKRLAIVVFIVILLWIISWTPYASVAFIAITGNRNIITPLTSMVPALFCKSAACLDPFIYSLSNPRVRKEIFKLICRERYEMEKRETVKSIWRTEITRFSFMKNNRKTATLDEVEEITLKISTKVKTNRIGSVQRLSSSSEKINCSS